MSKKNSKGTRICHASRWPSKQVLTYPFSSFWSVFRASHRPTWSFSPLYCQRLKTWHVCVPLKTAVMPVTGGGAHSMWLILRPELRALLQVCEILVISFDGGGNGRKNGGKDGGEPQWTSPDFTPVRPQMGFQIKNKLLNEI